MLAVKCDNAENLSRVGGQHDLEVIAGVVGGYQVIAALKARFEYRIGPTQNLGLGYA